ncbi:MAG: hypothetical protein H8D63_00965 [Parcubacteria group bacterium]|nr:hypothetical protein [Parcubacteria group bacterium]
MEETIISWSPSEGDDRRLQEEKNKRDFWRNVWVANGIIFAIAVLAILFSPSITLEYLNNEGEKMFVPVWNWGWFLLAMQFLYSVAYPLLPLFWERGEVEIPEELLKGAMNLNETEEKREERKNAGILTVKEYEIERMRWKSEKYPTVPSETYGMLTFMDALLFPLPDGLAYIPPFFGIKRDTKKIVQFELPPSELIYWGSGDVPEGMYAPLRFGQVGKPSKVEAEENNPLSNNQTTDGSIQARIRIDGKSLYEYFTTIGTLKNAEKMILDAMVSKVQAILGKKTPLWTKRNFDKVNEEITRALHKFVVGWGVVALDVYLVNYDYSHETNKSMRGVVVAEFERKATVTRAEGEREKRMLEGQGQADADKAIGDAKTDVLVKRTEELDVTGAEVLGAETAGDVAKNVEDLTVLGENVGSDTFKFGKLFDQGAKSNKGGKK